MSSIFYVNSSPINSRISTTFSYVDYKIKTFTFTYIKIIYHTLVMADLLDAVVDIHDKLHIDVVFNSSRDSSSSSVTIQSKS